MSYDISFKIRAYDTDEYINVGGTSANITWNLREMIEKSSGLPWKNEANNGFCTEVIPRIKNGYCELCLHPEKYRQYEAENGYGTLEGLKGFYKQVLDDWNTYVIHNSPQIVNVTTFWVE